MVRLFPTSEICVPDHPEEYGFHELELPGCLPVDQARSSRCWLPVEHIAHLSSPMLRVTATTGAASAI